MSSTVSIVIGILALLLLVAGAVRVLEPHLAFFPARGETMTPVDAGLEFHAATLRTSDGVSLRAWVLPHPAPRARIVYFHGNGGNLSLWTPILADIQRHGYLVRAFDYRGYGLSDGAPSERGLYRDVEAVVAWGRDASGVPLIYWGRSLGTTMAAYAASIAPPDGIILEAGFPDARTLLRSSPVLAFAGLFSSYRFSTATFLRDVSAPVLVIHGDRDQVVPYSAGRALFDRIRGPKRFLTIPGGDHNDALPRNGSAYWTAIESLVADARQPR